MLVAYLAGVIAPGLLVLATVVVLGGISLLAQAAGVGSILLRFLGLQSPYGAVAALMYRDIAPSMGVFILAAWMVAGLLLAVGRLPKEAPHGIWVASAIWALGWFAVSAVLGYFPDRYVLHAIVPLAVNVGAGLTLLQRIGKRRIVESLERIRGTRAILIAVLLSLPLAVLLVPTVIAAAGMGGLVLDRLRHHLILVLAVEVIIMATCMRGWRGDYLLAALVGLPIVVVALRPLLVLVGLLSPEFWRPSGAHDLAAWTALIALSAGGLGLAMVGGIRATRAAAAFSAAALATAWLAHTLPALVSPTYTILEAGRIVEDLAAEGERVGTPNAAGVLVGTRLYYTWHVGRPPFPDLLVIAYDREQHDPGENYRLERRLDLNLGEGHQGDDNIRIYRLGNDDPH